MFQSLWLKSLSKALFQLFNLTAGKAVSFDDNGQMKSVDGVGVTVDESELALSDNTTANASETKHGLLPKLSGNADEFLNGEGEFAEPAGGGGEEILASAAQNTFLLFPSESGGVTGFETITIGEDVYALLLVSEVGDLTQGGDFNNTAEVTLLIDDYPTLRDNFYGGFFEGLTLKVQDELLIVTAVTGTEATLSRGALGTAAAAHANGQTIFHSQSAAGPGGLGIPPPIGVPVLSTALLDIGKALAAAINTWGTEPFTAAVMALAVNHYPLVITASETGVIHNGVVCSTDFDPDITLQWESAATYGGQDAGEKNYILWQALLTQEGEHRPTVRVLVNELGVHVAASRANTGVYYFTNASEPFTAGKTFAFAQSCRDQSPTLGGEDDVFTPKWISAYAYEDSPGQVVLSTGGLEGMEDDVLDDTPLEIRVYR